MPKVYSEEQRDEIKEQLMDVGLQLIKQYGLKKMSIEAITKQVGIAQGTFYNFYKSKEILVYSMGNRYQEKLSERANQLVATKGYLEREDLQKFYQQMMLEDEDNVYRFLKREDLQMLLTRLPKDYLGRIADTKVAMNQNLEHIRGKRENCDLDAIINWVQVMNLTVENKELLVPTAFKKVIDQMIQNMLDEIFE